MKYPMINKQPRREVNIPSLSGGLNLRDGVSGIRDNQMTDCVNMWFKDGVLSTRPCLDTFDDGCLMVDVSDDHLEVENTNSNPAIKVHNEIKDIYGRTLVSYSCVDEKSSEDYLYYRINFMWHGAKEIKSGKSLKIRIKKSDNSSSQITSNKVSPYSGTGIGYGYFTVEKDGVVYVVVYFYGQYFYKKWQYEKELDFETMDELEDFYAPVVIVEDNLIRGYNLFGGRYRGRYEFNAAETKTKFDLPLPIPKNSKVRIWGTAGYEGVYEFTSDEDTEEITKEYLNSKLKIKVVRAKQSYIQFLTADGKAVDTVGELGVSLLGGYFQYNAVCDVSEDMHKVFGMQQCIYYGVGAEGISGGTRLFLGANRAGKERNLVMWSGLNNSLYWPENNYAYVGDKSQKVTGFGKQGENLMIFKEKSSYYSYGVSNSDISEEDIVNQTVIDLEASATYFVIKQFNDGIGCDLPNTIALCRNRLVWACTNGCVYTLVSNEQYNERTIFKVSEMIEPRLKSEKSMLYSRYESAIKHSYAFDCGDYYCLVVDNRIYVMDYNSYGYRYITSFSKSEDSNVQIPWYYWELPSFRKKAGKNDTNELTNILGDDGVHAVMMIDGCIVFVSYYLSAILNTKGLQDVIITDVLDFENTLDDTHDKCKKINNNKLLNTQIKEIGSSVSTKLFDFKSARYAKNIEGVSVGFGSNGGAPIMVEFVTDSGGNSEEIVIRNANIDERDAAFIRYRNFYPCMRAVRTFGLKFSCNGKLLIDGMNIQYRMLGGIK